MTFYTYKDLIDISVGGCAQTLSAYEISSSSKLDSGSMPITILQEGALVETVEERELLDRLMLDLQVKLAESSFAAPDAEK